MYKLCRWVFPAVVSGGLFAAEPALEDYAFMGELSESSARIQFVPLPSALLRQLSQRDLRDIAVFDSQGKLLPSGIAQLQPSLSTQQVDLEFHEFQTFLRHNPKTVTTLEQNQQEGQLSSSQTTETVATTRLRRDYVIELSPERNSPKINRIELIWTHQPQNQLLELKVEQGDDLDSLRVVHARKTLTNNDSANRDWRSIDNLSHGRKYLRLSPVNQVTSFELQRVIGFYEEREYPPNPTYRTTTRHVEFENNHYYGFNTPSAVKPLSFNILPAAPNSLLQGSLYGGNEGIDKRVRLNSRFIQHNIDDGSVKSSGAYHPDRYYSEFWFSPAGEITPPQVELAYRGYQVEFLANGRGPYTLAWGNYENPAQATNLAAILGVDLLEAYPPPAQVEIINIQESGGVARLTPEAELPWQKWLLWAVLFAGLLVTGKMALSLIRDMQSESGAD